MIDASVLTLLVNGYGEDHYVARAVSFTLAVSATWLGNRRWVFSPTEKAVPEYAGYFAVQIMGAVINLGVFVTVIELYPMLARLPVLPLAIGAAAALFFNFFASRRFVFAQVAPRGTANDCASAYSGLENLEAMSCATNYNAYLTDLVRSYAKGGTVLDFGAGTGTFAESLTCDGQQVLCVESDTYLRGKLHAKGFTVFEDLADIAVASLDYVYSLNVLEHIEDDQDILRQLEQRLRPGGRMLLYVPAFQVLFSAMDAKVGHFRRYRRQQLIAQVRQAGFEVVTSRYVDSMGFVATLLYKALGGNSGSLDARSVRLYDKFVFPVSRCLDHVTGGLFGKNLLVVARR
jgi:putative flippase GtrA/precorrin-6B methylase 2